MNETQGPTMTVDLSVQRQLPEGAQAADVAAIAIQERFGVMYRNYWIDERAGKVSCLIEAPTAEAVRATSRGTMIVQPVV